MSVMVIILSSLTVLLFVFLFTISFSSSKADNALAELMRYLRRLSSQPGEFKNMDPEQERVRTEILFNRVKTSHSVATLVSNKEMGDLLTSVIRLISSERLVRSDQFQSSFIQLTNLYTDFKLRYSDC